MHCKGASSVVSVRHLRNVGSRKVGRSTNDRNFKIRVEGTHITGSGVRDIDDGRSG